MNTFSKTPRAAALSAGRRSGGLPGPPLASEILSRLRVQPRGSNQVQLKPQTAFPGPPLASEILAKLRNNSASAPGQIQQKPAFPGPPLARDILVRFANKPHAIAQRKASHNVSSRFPPVPKVVIQRKDTFSLRSQAKAYGAIAMQFASRIVEVADGIDSGQLGDVDEGILPPGKPTVNSNGLYQNLEDVRQASEGKMGDFNSAYKHLQQNRSVTIGVGSDYTMTTSSGDVFAFQQKMIFSPQLAQVTKVTGKAAEQLGGLHGEKPGANEWKHIHLVITPDNPYPYDSYTLESSFSVTCADAAKEILKSVKAKKKAEFKQHVEGVEVTFQLGRAFSDGMLDYVKVEYMGTGVWEITGMKARAFKGSF